MDDILTQAAKGLITKAEAARQLGCSPRSIGRRLAKHKTPSDEAQAVETVPQSLPEMSEVQTLKENLRALEDSVVLMQQVITNQESLIKSLMPVEKNQLRSNQVTLVAESLEIRVSSDTFSRCTQDGWKNVTCSEVSLVEGGNNTQFTTPYRAFLGKHYMGRYSHHTLPAGVSIGDFVYIVIGNADVLVNQYSRTYRTSLFANVHLVTTDRELALQSVGANKFLHALRVS